MFFSLIANSPLVALAWIVVILISLTVHEFAHAWVGHLKGDKTAELMGRLSLNPIVHIDPLGFIPLLLFGFGWAKPVPFNPYNLKDPKKDAVIIALAGPASNLILAVLAAVILRVVVFSGLAGQGSLLEAFLILLVIINLFLLFFNILPVHPLDGSKLIDALLTSPKHMHIRNAIATYGPQALLILVVLSIVTPFNVFFFVSAPAYLTCDVLVGESCAAFLASVF